jgi:hypothetical protein
MTRQLTLALIAVAGLSAQDKPRVFITDSTSWQMVGRAGGARPQTAEIYKTFGASCPAVTVTNNRDRADYVVTLDHEGGKGYLRRDNKMAVFNKEGDMITSSSTRALGSAVKDACAAITGK